MSTKADLFLVREWAGTNKGRYWATIIWNRTEPYGLTMSNEKNADCAGFTLDCAAAPTRKEAEKIGREYAKKLGLTLPKAKYS